VNARLIRQTIKERYLPITPGRVDYSLRPRVNRRGSTCSTKSRRPMPLDERNLSPIFLRGVEMYPRFLPSPATRRRCCGPRREAHGASLKVRSKRRTSIPGWQAALASLGRSSSRD